MSAAQRVWTLEAHQQKELVADPDLWAPALELAPLLQVEAASPGKLRLRTSGIVGTMVSGPLKVVVSPRHLSRNVALGLVLGGRDMEIPPVPGVAAEDPDLLRVVAIAYFEELRRLFQRGLRRDYRDLRIRPDPLRGELDLDRWHGPKSPDAGGLPWCKVRERTTDLPEHRLLRGALHLLARSEALEAGLRHRAAALSNRLEDVSADPPRRSSWSTLRRTGLFAPYSQALDLAELLLDGLLGEGEQLVGAGFLLDLDRLYERWLAATLRTLAPEGWRVEAQEQVTISSPRLHRDLDVSIWDPEGRRVAILDAKNKAFHLGAPPRDDVHQLISYMTTLSCPLGALVGIQAPDTPLCTNYRLRGDAGRLCVVRLPGQQRLADLKEALQRWTAVLGAAWHGGS